MLVILDALPPPPPGTLCPHPYPYPAHAHAQVVVSPEGVLTVQGEKKQEEQQLAASGKEGETSGSTAPARYSRRYSAFKRSVLLPGDVKEEAINATVKNGVLTITVPKVPMPEATKPREIPVHMA